MSRARAVGELLPPVEGSTVRPALDSRPRLATRVTIGLPLYNGEQFLRDALDSILGQTFADFTLVVSDNASTDASVDIVEEYAASDHRIRLFRSPVNRGAAWNYNEVFRRSESPYFKWAAADDKLAPTCLERLIEALDAAPPEVAAVYPLTQIIDAEGRPVRTHAENLAAPVGSPPHLRLGHVLRNLYLGNAVYALARADALRRTRLHGPFPSSDYVLLAELALVGEFREVPEPLFLRRLHEGTSVQANPTLAERTAWFDPERRPVSNRLRTLFQQYLAGIHHTDLPPLEKLRTYATFFKTVAKPRTRLERLAGRIGRRG